MIYKEWENDKLYIRFKSIYNYDADGNEVERVVMNYNENSY